MKEIRLEELKRRPKDILKLTQVSDLDFEVEFIA